MKAFIRTLAGRIFKGSIFSVFVCTVLLLIFHISVLYLTVVRKLSFSAPVEIVFEILSFVFFVLFGGNIIAAVLRSDALRKRRFCKNIMEEKYVKIESENNVDYLVK